MKKNYTNVDEYIMDFPEDVSVILKKIRAVILEKAPGAEENISYGMPAYKVQKKSLVYFAGFKNHIGFYATPSGHTEFHEKLSAYKQGKGSVQFPIKKPIPFDLIAEIVEFRLNENNSKA